MEVVLPILFLTLCCCFQRLKRTDTPMKVARAFSLMACALGIFHFVMMSFLSCIALGRNIFWFLGSVAMLTGISTFLTMVRESLGASNLSHPDARVFNLVFFFSCCLQLLVNRWRSPRNCAGRRRTVRSTGLRTCALSLGYCGSPWEGGPSACGKPRSTRTNSETTKIAVCSLCPPTSWSSRKRRTTAPRRNTPTISRQSPKKAKPPPILERQRMLRINSRFGRAVSLCACCVCGFIHAEDRGQELSL